MERIRRLVPLSLLHRLLDHPPGGRSALVLHRPSAYKSASDLPPNRQFRGSRDSQCAASSSSSLCPLSQHAKDARIDGDKK
ncbi:hypothetical protein DBV15_08704 [Temnothorax longispinosus]|uniref:Uncharacterized protein n=1 Tax=Temnothorax longispinosus TaxID=300112 RepID=A0A4V3S7J3_9HYME|nr:hypothetical protein DBV15_08704 [Temnothorax longispinosus]